MLQINCSWLPKSPNLNPTEHIWDLLERRIRQRSDETWCFQYDAEEKTTKCGMDVRKHSFCTFFDARGIIHKEFAPTGQTIPGQYYLDVLECLMARICRICPEYRTESSWCLKHDNAPSSTSLLVCQFLAKNVCVLNLPPYSSDLAPWDYSFKDMLKSVLKDEWEKISAKETTGLVNSIPKRLQEVLKRWGYPTSY
ncbi:uncharacterized protein TNCV_346971 [Trichonephila clavipes]|nr:uncharacterized protein TNCV_346971 [Trichonephila clavipes]